MGSFDRCEFWVCMKTAELQDCRNLFIKMSNYEANPVGFLYERYQSSGVSPLYEVFVWNWHHRFKVPCQFIIFYKTCLWVVFRWSCHAVRPMPLYSLQSWLCHRCFFFRISRFKALCNCPTWCFLPFELLLWKYLKPTLCSRTYIEAFHSGPCCDSNRVEQEDCKEPGSKNDAWQAGGGNWRSYPWWSDVF